LTVELGIAGLPMYDWPETAEAMDRLWQRLRQALGARRIAAPDALTRSVSANQLWRSPRLVVGQTCGFPYWMELRDAVRLVGTPVYRLTGCGPGDYYSVVICAADAPAESIADLRGGVAVFNSRDSLSGYSALRAAVAPFAGSRPFFKRIATPGAHRESIRMIARGEADIAAIDAVVWKLALRHEPAARHCRVLATTDPMPGLPIITAPRNDPEKIAEAFSEALSDLGSADRDTLLMAGFRRRLAVEYRVVDDSAREDALRGYRDLR